MFTGIVEEVGKVLAVSGGDFRFQAQVVLEGVKLGDSIAVNGACLTVVRRAARRGGPAACSLTRWKMRRGTSPIHSA